MAVSTISDTSSSLLLPPFSLPSLIVHAFCEHRATLVYYAPEAASALRDPNEDDNGMMT